MLGKGSFDGIFYVEYLCKISSQSVKWLQRKLNFFFKKCNRMKLLFQVNVHDYSMNAIKPGVALLSSLVSGMMHRGPGATRRRALGTCYVSILVKILTRMEYEN